MSIAARFTGLSLRAARIEHGLRAIDLAPHLAVRTAEGCRRLERLSSVPSSTRDRYVRALRAALVARAESLGDDPSSATAPFALLLKTRTARRDLPSRSKEGGDGRRPPA